MGVRVAVIICTTSFLLGAFFTHWIADSVTLWQSPLTDAHLHAAAAYYSILSTMPRWMVSVFVVTSTATAASLLLNVYDGRAGNIMFDGASLFLSSCALAVWGYSVIPNIARLSPRIFESGPFPSEFRQPTLEVASKNLVCSVALTGVLLLQAGRQWAEAKDGSNSKREMDTSALADEPATPHDLDTPRIEVARGRRRSHHDHLELDLDDDSASTSSTRSASPRKKDGSYRKRRSTAGQTRRRSAGEPAG